MVFWCCFPIHLQILHWYARYAGMDQGNKISSYRDAPRIEAEAWVRLMSRRVEAQLSRDWNFGFVSWNYIFRSTINQSRTFFAYDRKHEVPVSNDVQRVENHQMPRAKQTGLHLVLFQRATAEGVSTTRTQMGFTPQEFLEGAKQLCKALGGKYRDLDGKLQSSQR